METFILFGDKRYLPNMTDLVSYMWAENISFSYFKTGLDFLDSDLMALSWDKWIDNPKWSGHSNSKEYIELETGRINENSYIQRMIDLIPQHLNAVYFISVEIDDEAVLIDKRAYTRGIYFISNSCNGYIIDINNNLLSPFEYLELNKLIIELPFSKEIQ